MVLLLIGLSLGGLLLLGGAAWALHNYGDLFSYTGLSGSDILRVRKRLSKYYDLLSSVNGRDLWGNTFTRGIYVPKGGGTPLYYRYTVSRDGKNRSFDLYPMLVEKWTTNPTFLSLDGRTRMIAP